MIETVKATRRGTTGAAIVLLLAGCGGGPDLDEAKIERCATALVPYASAAASGKGFSFEQLSACTDLNANEKSESVARMYRKQSEQAEQTQ